MGSDAARAFATPLAIERLGPVSQVASGWNHVCALEKAGQIKCWGRNTEGQLGDGKTGSRIKPVVVADIRTGIELVSGHNHTCARTRDGGVWCWGDNSAGQLGAGARGEPKTYTPVRMPNLGRVVALESGARHNCARLDSGRLTCWGNNDAGQLGTRASARPTPPTTVRGVQDAIDAALGTRHTCVLRKGGEVSCFGDAKEAALGPYGPR